MAQRVSLELRAAEERKRSAISDEGWVKPVLLAPLARRDRPVLQGRRPARLQRLPRHRLRFGLSARIATRPAALRNARKMKRSSSPIVASRETPRSIRRTGPQPAEHARHRTIHSSLHARKLNNARG